MSAGAMPTWRANRFAARARLLAWSCSRAAAAESAANTLTPAIAYGWSSWSDGLNSLRYASSAASSAPGAKCEANAYGRPSAAASRAPNSEEPSMYSGTLEPLPGTASTPGTRDVPAR